MRVAATNLFMDCLCDKQTSSSIEGMIVFRGVALEDKLVIIMRYQSECQIRKMVVPPISGEMDTSVLHIGFDPGRALDGHSGHLRATYGPTAYSRYSTVLRHGTCGLWFFPRHPAPTLSPSLTGQNTACHSFVASSRVSSHTGDAVVEDNLRLKDKTFTAT